MDYMISQDLESILAIKELTLEDLAEKFGVSRITISNWIHDKTQISEKHQMGFYDYAFKTGIRLNKIKEQFYREDAIKENEVLLFHGAKTEIVGELSLKHNKRINDFGRGFYCGESLEQSAMFVATQPKSSLYMLKFDPTGLKRKAYKVNRDWMLTIAYYRGRLEEYNRTEVIQKLIQSLNNVDYIIAPIADNRMFEIIDNFINGEITDVQCQHCLSATNLGMQYVFISENALKNITLLEKCYLTNLEKDAYLNARQDNFKMNMDKVKLARKQYRNQGEYIEDILT